VKLLRDLLHPDQLALYQRSQSGDRHSHSRQNDPQIADTHAAAYRCQLCENGGLIVVQFGEAYVRDEYGDLLQAASIALLRDRVAHQPLLANHSLEQSLIRAGSRPQRRHLCLLSTLQIIQDGVLAVLVLHRELRPPRRSLRRSFVQDLPPCLCEAIKKKPLYLRG